MKHYFEYKILEKEKLEKYKKVDKTNPHKFLFESIMKEILFYTNQDESEKYVSFFSEISFKEVEKEKNSSKTNIDLFAYYIELSDYEKLSDKDKSLLLRDSTTFKETESNTYDGSNIKVVFTEKGFLYLAKYDNQFDHFKRVRLLFLLSQAYNLYTEKLINDISYFYSIDNYRKMIDLRKTIYVFDLNCFFFNPVPYKYHQLNILWSYISNIYFINQKHDEMKSQMEDLVNLIELNNKEEERKDRETGKLEEEKRYRRIKEEREKEKLEKEKYHQEFLQREIERDRLLLEEREKENKKSTRRTNILTLIGLLFAAFSIGSVYADLVDLGAVKNVFEQEKQISLNQQDSK